MLLDRLDTRIVGGQDQVQVPLEPVQQEPQVAHSSADVLIGIEDIAHVVQPGGSRQER